jgi:cobalt-zinc-cadmium efflux system protein
MYALSCHVLIADLPPSESASILRSLETLLSDKYRIGHTTIQFESHTHQEAYCSVDGLYCQLEAIGDLAHERDHPHRHAHDHAPDAPATTGERSAAEQEGA